MSFLFFDCNLYTHTQVEQSSNENGNVTQKHIELLESIVKSDENELEPIDKHDVFHNFFIVLDELVSKWKINFCGLRKYLIATTKYRQLKNIDCNVDGKSITSKPNKQRVSSIVIPFGDRMKDQDDRGNKQIVVNQQKNDIWGIKNITIRLDDVLSGEDVLVLSSGNEKAKKTDHYEIKMRVNLPIAGYIPTQYNNKWNECDIFEIKVNQLEKMSVELIITNYHSLEQLMSTLNVLPIT